MEARLLARAMGIVEIVAVCVWVALAHACGPDELPAFANPPPVDSDDGGVGADAGGAQAR